MTLKIEAKGQPGYDVLIGRGLLDDLDASLGEQVRKVLLVYPEGLQASAEVIADTLIEQGKQVWQLPVADGEDAKTDRWLSIAWSSLGQAEFSRSDAVVSLGGGATTDLAGFIAATWLRGIAVVHVPTTLLCLIKISHRSIASLGECPSQHSTGIFNQGRKTLDI
jgi:3-dehydroquinate synthase